ncbi:serine dehydratase subunit alpha family protein [Clostridium sp. Mt-5]|uniref:UPF0597 protein AB8U03_10395 n=1 Tax=Clostridium moutaii TaxID=3240932 RepID=A0ABV4BSV9_9CLOT
MKDYKLLVDILKDQVVPALGCTEPTAVAYAVAKAKETLGGDINGLDIYVDKNIFKNGKEVGIPGTDRKGILTAAALSMVVGKSEYKLQVLKDVSDKSLKSALNIIDKNIIKLNLKKDVRGLYIEVIARQKGSYSRVIIKNSHLNIILIEKNGQCIFSQNEKDSIVNKSSLRDKIKVFTIEDFKDFVDNISYDSIRFIEDGIAMNEDIGKTGLKLDLGIGIGNLFNDSSSVGQYAKAITSAASEARMSGYPMPVMSSAGSGNHGLVAILPIAIVGEKMKLGKEKIVRSVSLSHLVTIYIKSYIGALSPVCGCGVAAGVGASAGLSYLMGGNLIQIKGAIKNMIAGISGMICDGAKIGCSYKLAISVNAALDAAKMANRNIFIPSKDGILDESAEKTIQNLGRISVEGMANTDGVILDVMMEGCK